MNGHRTLRHARAATSTHGPPRFIDPSPKPRGQPYRLPGSRQARPLRADEPWRCRSPAARTHYQLT